MKSSLLIYLFFAMFVGSVNASQKYIFMEKAPSLKMFKKVVVPKISKRDIKIGKGQRLGKKFVLVYSLKNQKEALSREEMSNLDKGFYVIHWILYKTDYLQDISKMNFKTTSGKQVAARIKYTSYRIDLVIKEGLKGKTTGKSLLGTAGLNSNKITMNKSRLHKDIIKVARTIFHEMIHNVGYDHDNHEFISVFGELMKEHYDKHREEIVADYETFFLRLVSPVADQIGCAIQPGLRVD